MHVVLEAGMIDLTLGINSTEVMKDARKSQLISIIKKQSDVDMAKFRAYPKSQTMHWSKYLSAIM
jgi:hypothetical protein